MDSILVWLQYSSGLVGRISENRTGMRSVETDEEKLGMKTWEA